MGVFKGKCGCGSGDGHEEIISEISDGFTRVWILEGCMICNACETTCPELFLVTHDSVVFTKNAKNELSQYREMIQEAVEGCPCEVLGFEVLGDVDP